MSLVDRIKSMWAGVGSTPEVELDTVVAEPTSPHGPATTPSTADELDPATLNAKAIGDVLRLHIAEQSDGVHTLETIDADAHLFDQGYLDSLSSVSLVTLVEERYRVSIEEVELVGRLSSVDALAEHIAAVVLEGPDEVREEATSPLPRRDDNV